MLRPHRPALTALAGLTILFGVLVAPPASALSLVPGENVTTRNGVVQGSVSLDHRSFKGIPFAAPPLGKLRFAPPTPATSWSGERSARSSGPACAR